MVNANTDAMRSNEATWCHRKRKYINTHRVTTVYTLTLSYPNPVVIYSTDRRLAGFNIDVNVSLATVA